MLQGGYPRIYDTRMPLNLFFSNYIDTYIERDVSEYLDVRNLADFRRFLTLCALSSGALRKLHQHRQRTWCKSANRKGMDVNSGIKLHRIPSHAVLHERTQTGGQNAETLFL